MVTSATVRRSKHQRGLGDLDPAMAAALAAVEVQPLDGVGGRVVQLLALRREILEATDPRSSRGRNAAGRAQNIEPDGKSSARRGERVMPMRAARPWRRRNCRSSPANGGSPRNAAAPPCQDPAAGRTRPARCARSPAIRARSRTGKTATAPGRRVVRHLGVQVQHQVIPVIGIGEAHQLRCDIAPPVGRDPHLHACPCPRREGCLQRRLLLRACRWRAAGPPGRAGWRSRTAPPGDGGVEQVAHHADARLRRRGRIAERHGSAPILRPPDGWSAAPDRRRRAGGGRPVLRPGLRLGLTMHDLQARTRIAHLRR